MSRIATKSWCNDLAGSSVFGSQSSSNNLQKCTTVNDFNNTNVKAKLMVKKFGTTWDSLSWSDLVNYYTDGTRLVRQSHIGHKVKFSYTRDFYGVPFTMYVCKNGFTENRSGNVPDSSKTLSITPFTKSECNSESDLTKNVGFTSSFFKNMLEQDWKNSRIVVEFLDGSENKTNIAKSFEISGFSGTKSSGEKYFSWSNSDTIKIFNQLKSNNALTINAALPEAFIVNIKPKNIHLGAIQLNNTYTYNTVKLSAYDRNGTNIEEYSSTLEWSLSNTYRAQIDPIKGIVTPVQTGNTGVTTAMVLYKTNTIAEINTADVYIDRDCVYELVMTPNAILSGNSIINTGLNEITAYECPGAIGVNHDIYKAINKRTIAGQTNYNLIDSEIISEEWISSDDSIIKVWKNTDSSSDADAQFKLLSLPTLDTIVTITYKCTSQYGGDLTKNYHVKVLATSPEISVLQFDPSSITLPVRGTSRWIVKLYYNNEDVTREATYTSDDSSIASVSTDNKGIVITTGDNVGNCIITGTYTNENNEIFNAYLKVIVNNELEPNDLRFDPSSIIIFANDFFEVIDNVKLYYNNVDVTTSQSVSYTSSNTNIAEVDLIKDSGDLKGIFMISGKNEGTCVITANYNGKLAELQVTVTSNSILPLPDEIAAKAFDLRIRNASEVGTFMKLDLGQVCTKVSATKPSASDLGTGYLFYDAAIIDKEANGYITNITDLPEYSKSDYDNLWIKLLLSSFSVSSTIDGDLITDRKYACSIKYISGGEREGSSIDTTIKDLGSCGPNFNMKSGMLINYHSDWIKLSTLIDSSDYNSTKRFGVLISANAIYRPYQDN